jgi:hypothetical protein
VLLLIVVTFDNNLFLPLAKMLLLPNRKLVQIIDTQLIAGTINGGPFRAMLTIEKHLVETKIFFGNESRHVFFNFN